MERAQPGAVRKAETEPGASSAAETLVRDSEPAAEHLEELDRYRRILLQERLEIPAGEHETAGRIQCPDRRRPGSVVQEGHLAEEVAGAVGAERPPVPEYLDPAGQDQVVVQEANSGTFARNSVVDMWSPPARAVIF
jgi:hypothetical protein